MPESKNTLPPQQEPPAYTDQMKPMPDHGETSCRDSDNLTGGHGRAMI